MNKMFLSFLAAGICSISAARADTFVIEAEGSAHEATVKIPVSAVTKLSANFAESLVGYADPQIEAMRLSGDVLISVAGSQQPIQIKADKILLELTADRDAGPGKGGRSNAEGAKALPPSGTPPSQIVVSNGVYDLQTLFGPMQIKADRVEHRATVEAGA
jgi:hypothetical protein